MRHQTLKEYQRVLNLIRRLVALIDSRQRRQLERNGRHFNDSTSMSAGILQLHVHFTSKIDYFYSSTPPTLLAEDTGDDEASAAVDDEASADYCCIKLMQNKSHQNCWTFRRQILASKLLDIAGLN